MALKLSKTVKGIECEYWAITEVLAEKVSQTTRVQISVFKDRASREASISNSLESKFLSFPGYITDLSELYGKVKAPVYVTEINSEGNETQVNTNEYTNAEDC